jgi:RNA polymerase sigma-70 factor (ECF subfamily)
MTSATGNNNTAQKTPVMADKEYLPVPDSDSTTMEEFLKSVERRAFHMARMRTGSADVAMDIVQDSMFKLVQKYSNKSCAEWRPLFYRILNSKLTDYYRRKAVRDRVFFWSGQGDSQDDFKDIIENSPGLASETPHKMLARQQRIKQIGAALERLPRRQREAFMLRCWEGMSTIETAKSMDCSEGSVKTHYSRAMHSLRDYLKDYQHD